MFESQHDAAGQSTLAIDIAPLIDVVFILLIFFLVTTSFLKDTGIDVELPAATQAHSMDSGSLRVAVTASGAVYTDGARIGLEQLRARVRDFAASHPRASVLVLPDRELRSGTLMEVLDEIRAAGGTVAIAAQNRTEAGR